MSYISAGEPVGPPDNNFSNQSTFSNTNTLIFDVAQPVVIDGVTVYPNSAGNVVVTVSDSGGTVLHTATVAVAGPGRPYIPLHFSLHVGTAFEMSAAGSTAVLRWNLGGTSYPYTNGDVSITGTTGPVANYYYFYDWQVHPAFDTILPVGPADNAFGSGSYIASMNIALLFDLARDTLIRGVYAYPAGAGLVVVNVWDSANNLIATQAFPVSGPGRTYIPLNFSIPAGGFRAANYLTLTLDMTNYSASTDPIELTFWVNSHGGNTLDAADYVWIRGSATDPWIEVVNLPMEVSLDGVYTEVTVDLSTELLVASQDFGSTFGVRFGEQDNWTAYTMVLADGYSFDDILIFLNQVCGNGAVEGTEACDDGNADNTDDCLDTCVVATCGDGYAWAGTEDCDDANADNTDACLDTCVTASCGDGHVLAGTEECDDGNSDNTDICLDTCVAASCGDGYVLTGTEDCDDANADNSDLCLNTCVNASCGDGYILAGTEECDDSNNANHDGCDNVCVMEYGFDCTGEPSTCASVCGDGVLAANEGCDDGDITAGDGCDASCVVETGWTCTGDPSVCAELCGDGVVDTGEDCDDGNITTGDGCDASCNVETGWTCTGDPSVCTEDGVCGDRAVDDGEGCDDGNTTAGDGCDDACVVETGWTCTGDPSVCTQDGGTCGDGEVNTGETCDDGNATAGDGCDASCAVETGWLCTDTPSDCCEDADYDGVCDVPVGTGDSGCGCTTGNTRDHSIPVMFLLIGMLLFWRRRRG